MAHGYNGQPILFIDIPREYEQFLKCRHYAAFSEKVKDGLLFSGKFDSGMKCWETPHVMFCSNHKPWAALEGKEAFTQDRLVLLDLSEPHWHEETILEHMELPGGEPELLQSLPVLTGVL